MVNKFLASLGIGLTLMLSSFGHAAEVSQGQFELSLFAHRTSQIERLYREWQGVVSYEEQLIYLRDEYPELMADLAVPLREYTTNLALAFRTHASAFPQMPKKLERARERIQNDLRSSRLLFNRGLTAKQRERIFYMERNLAHAQGISLAALYQAIDLILMPSKIVALADQDLLRAQLPTNPYSDSLRQAFAEALFPVLPIAAFKLKTRGSHAESVRNALLNLLNADDANAGISVTPRSRFRFESVNYRPNDIREIDARTRLRSRDYLLHLAIDYLHALDHLRRLRPRIAAMTPSKLVTTTRSEIDHLGAQLVFELQTLPQRLVAREYGDKNAPERWKSTEWFDYGQDRVGQERSVRAEEWPRIMGDAAAALGVDGPALLASFERSGESTSCGAALDKP